MATTFIHDLNKLIARHLGKPKRGDDFEPFVVALHDAADKLALRADRHRFADETAAEFRARRAA